MPLARCALYMKTKMESGPKKRALLVKVIVKSGPGNFYGLAIHADFIYWSDWARRSVLRSNKYTGSDTKVLRADIPHQPMGIIAVARDTDNCKYLTKPKPVDVMSGNISGPGVSTESAGLCTLILIMDS